MAYEDPKAKSGLRMRGSAGFVGCPFPDMGVSIFVEKYTQMGSGRNVS